MGFMLFKGSLPWPSICSYFVSYTPKSFIKNDFLLPFFAYFCRPNLEENCLLQSLNNNCLWKI